MPTKPVTTYVFGTDALFGSGPASGLATKIIPPSLAQGFIPGTGVAAEHVNFLHNIVGSWLTDWIDLGTSAADEDAHLVETNSAGRIAGAFITAGGSTGSDDVATFTAVAGNTATNVVLVTTSDDASQNGINVVGTAGNVGIGVQVTPAAGRGIRVTTSNGTDSPLQLVARDLPTNELTGDIYVNAANLPFADQVLNVFLDGLWRKQWGTVGGLIHGYGETLAESSTSAGGSLTAKATAVLSAGQAILIGDVLQVRGICESGADAANSAMNVGLRDVTNGVDFAVRSVQHFQATGAADERYVVVEAEYTAVSAGAQSFAIGFSSNGAATVYIQNASIEVTGIYD